MTDREHRSEEELNRMRKAQHEAKEDDDGGVIDTVEDAFESVVNPLVTEDVDEEDIARRRIANDQAAREP